jgi:hypothetical protein
MSYGARAVGLSFNPSNDNNVDKIKALYAEIINFCDIARCSTTDSETRRLYSVAITEAQTAQMWAVKAITWKA